MEVKSLWIGNYKLLANLARFDRNVKPKVRIADQGRKQISFPGRREAGISYLQVSRRKDSDGREEELRQRDSGEKGGSLLSEKVARPVKPLEQAAEVVEKNVDRCLLDGRTENFIPLQSDVKWAQSCLVGIVKNGIKESELAEFIQARGYKNMRVINLSEELLVLYSELVEERDKILN